MHAFPHFLWSDDVLVLLSFSNNLRVANFGLTDSPITPFFTTSSPSGNKSSNNFVINDTWCDCSNKNRNKYKFRKKAEMLAFFSLISCVRQIYSFVKQTYPLKLLILLLVFLVSACNQPIAITTPTDVVCWGCSVEGMAALT